MTRRNRGLSGRISGSVTHLEDGMRRFSRFLSIVLVASGVVVATVSGADSPSTRTVVAGAQYKAGGCHRWLWGGDYRGLWATPITPERLRPHNEAGRPKP